MNSEVEKIYKEAIRLSYSHYENFPVLSFLLPKEILPHVAIIYKFAREADDIADEGEKPPEERIALLEERKKHLSDALNGNYHSPFYEALHNTIEKFQLSSKNLFNLLEAFLQDVKKNRYATQSELLEYCERSANPVGRIILELFDRRDEKTFALSDKICTALQLTNFWQDVSVDLQKNRIYIPKEILEKFHYTEELLFEKKFNENFRQLMEYEVNFTKKLFYEGRDILNKLPFRLKAEINATILGGFEILKKIEKINFNVLDYRVKLNKKDFLFLFLKTFLTLE